VEAGLNTSATALQVVGGDKKGDPVPGDIIDHPISGGYKYRDLALQAGGVSNRDNKMWS
jgi:hypothetical protein